jgi:CRISPR/Cas system-associated endonuclease Cas1
MTRVLISRGLDPACGFLHADKPGGFSLANDALELIRPKVTDLVMQWVTLRTFRKDDFGTFEQGIVRLSSETAREVASRVLKTIPIQEYDAAARAFIAMLSTSPNILRPANPAKPTRNLPFS